MFFQKSKLAQTMRPIVPYNHAKTWEDPYLFIRLDIPRTNSSQNGNMMEHYI